MISLAIQRKYLLDNGWKTYQGWNNWVHQKVVFDPLTQDYLQYGMNINHAVVYEFLKCPAFKEIGVPPVELPSYSHSDWYDINKILNLLQKPGDIKIKKVDKKKLKKRKGKG